MTVFVNITYDAIIGGKIDYAIRNFTVEAESEWSRIFEIGPRALINQVNITVEVSDNFASKQGLSIGRLHILN